MIYIVSNHDIGLGILLYFCYLEFINLVANTSLICFWKGCILKEKTHNLNYKHIYELFLELPYFERKIVLHIRCQYTQASGHAEFRKCCNICWKHFLNKCTKLNLKKISNAISQKMQKKR